MLSVLKKSNKKCYLMLEKYFVQFNNSWHRISKTWLLWFLLFSEPYEHLLFLLFFFKFIYITILYWFCHTLTWICHGCTCVPHPEPPSHFPSPFSLPPQPIPLGHPSAPAPSTLYHASNLDWRIVSHMILYMFQYHSPISSRPRPLPQSPNRVMWIC